MKKIRTISIPPQIISGCLWSYDPSEIDMRRNKELIISQVLNYGNWEEVKWLYEIYSEEEIKEVVSSPLRGVWFRRALNFWVTILNLDLSENVYKRAIFDLNPNPGTRDSKIVISDS